jgi:hypothetical protein
MKLEFTRQIFEKYSVINLHENPSIGAELFHAAGQTDRHVEANSRFSQFCELVQKMGETWKLSRKKNASSEIGAHWIEKYFHLKDKIIEGVFDYFLRSAIKLVCGRG